MAQDLVGGDGDGDGYGCANTPRPLALSFSPMVIPGKSISLS